MNNETNLKIKITNNDKKYKVENIIIQSKL